MKVRPSLNFDVPIVSERAEIGERSSMSALVKI